MLVPDGEPEGGAAQDVDTVGVQVGVVGQQLPDRLNVPELRRVQKLLLDVTLQHKGRFTGV